MLFNRDVTPITSYGMPKAALLDKKKRRPSVPLSLQSNSFSSSSVVKQRMSPSLMRSYAILASLGGGVLTQTNFNKPEPSLNRSSAIRNSCASSSGSLTTSPPLLPSRRIVTLTPAPVAPAWGCETSGCCPIGESTSSSLVCSVMWCSVV